MYYYKIYLYCVYFPLTREKFKITHFARKLFQCYIAIGIYALLSLGVHKGRDHITIYYSLQL